MMRGHRSGEQEPRADESPTAFADRLGQWARTLVPEARQRALGVFLTPVDVARFMAGLVAAKGDIIRVLDPGAGTAVLSSALAEALACRPRPPSQLRITAWEVDPTLAKLAGTSLSYLRRWLSRRSISLDFEVRSSDFVLELIDRLRGERDLFSEHESQRFDVAIANPPYFKLPKSDPRAASATQIVHGQPNIYALFMAAASEVLVEGGELVFITPRSFASGTYFRRFRKEFFRAMQPEWIHVFDSRKQAFKRDEVLQENVVLRATKRPDWHHDRPRIKIVISSTNGASDLSHPRTRRVAANVALDLASPEKFLFIPTSAGDDRALALVRSWKGSLHGYGMEISTGPVVAFRARVLIHGAPGRDGSRLPLLWMQHVRATGIEWPLAGGRKPQYIDSEAGDRSLLLPDRTYVVLRRFSAKEERRRLTAAPLFAGSLGARAIGLENHLNYIHRPKGTLGVDEARGIAALYNSTLLDRFFRILNGSTQVNATELRAIPLPDRDLIIDLGRRVRDTSDLGEINRLACSAVGWDRA